MKTRALLLTVHAFSLAALLTIPAEAGSDQDSSKAGLHRVDAPATRRSHPSALV